MQNTSTTLPDVTEVTVVVRLVEDSSDAFARLLESPVTGVVIGTVLTGLIALGTGILANRRHRMTISASERQHRESLAHSRKEADRRDAARAYGNASDVLFRLARARAFLRPGNEDRSSFLSHISELRSESESVRSELRVIHVLGWSDEFREAVIQLETTMFSCMSLIDFIAQEVSDGSTSLEEADSRMEAALERTGPPLIEYRELMK